MEKDLDDIRRWKAGSDAAYDNLFKRYYSSLCRTANHILQNEQSAEDVVQEFFISLWNKKETLNIETNVAGYLKRAVVNRSINYIKSTKNSRRHQDLEKATERIAAPEDKHMDQSDQRRAIKRCVDKLSEKKRIIFILNRYEELSYKEIAAQLDITVKTVEVQLRNARLSLRECLKYFLKENYTFG